MVGIMKGMMSEELKEKWLGRIAAEQALMCGSFSEDRAGFTGLADTTATPVDGGYKIKGKKTWATLSEAAELVTFNATVLNPDGTWPEDHMERMARERVFITDKNQDAISVVRTWDTHGMRATGTQTIVFDDVFIPAEDEVGDMRMGLGGEFEWAALLFGGVYLGLAVKAFEVTRDILLSKSIGATAMASDTALRDVGWIQWGLGEMKAQCEIADRVVEQTANILIAGRDADWPALERGPLIDIVKVATTAAARHTTNNGMRLIGGTTFRRGHVIERLYRDSRSGLYQPLTTDACFELLGKFELDLIKMPGADAPAENGSATEAESAPAGATA
jgi:alkylation response protein AidB-like acyl-CoA dehydrogenase